MMAQQSIDSDNFSHRKWVDSHNYDMTHFGCNNAQLDQLFFDNLHASLSGTRNIISFLRD